MSNLRPRSEVRAVPGERALAQSLLFGMLKDNAL